MAKQIARAIPYLKHGHGGVTISGGDPLIQPDWVAAIFEECHRMGVPTAIDTTGMGNRSQWKKVLKVTDLVMLCVKAPRPDSYRWLTGGFNQDGMLKFAETTRQVGW